MSCDTPARLTHYSGRCHLNHIKVKSSQVSFFLKRVRSCSRPVAMCPIDPSAANPSRPGSSAVSELQSGALPLLM
jgi:hypothetical protein